MSRRIFSTAGVAVILRGLFFGFFLFVSVIAAKAEIKPLDLRCEYQAQPLNIAAPHPRLFWKLKGDGRARRQTAYQIIAASSLEQLARNQGDLWDSGQVISGETVQIPYNGKTLASAQQAFWKVRVWDEQGKTGGWSKPASWTMTLLSPGDWTAKWVGYPLAKDAVSTGLTGAKWLWHAPDGDTPPAGKRWFRATLNLPADTAFTLAKLLISADDQYTVTVNNTPLRVGPRGTDAWRNYQVYDVARDLRVGSNTVLVEAVNTSAGPAGVIARLLVVTPAQTLTLATNADWETSDTLAGPYVPARVVGELGVAPWGMLSSANGTDRTPPPYFRKNFAITKPVKRALLYATALGVYELSLNGRRVSNDVLSPGWTDFRRRAYYLAYDVTKQVKPGANALGAILGDGWYASYLAFTGKHHYYGGEPKLRLQLRIEYKDGTSANTGTDETWKTAYGPIQYADMLMGCLTDTRRELTGWDTAKFADTGWNTVAVQEAPPLAIEAKPNEPIRPLDYLKTRTRTEPAKGVFLYNIGQNMVGWARVKITGQPGETISVRYGERLNPDGTLYTTNLRSARATDTFVLKGGTQTLEPHFTFHGFQYVEITGASAPPEPKDVGGVVVSSDLKPTLAFNSDNPLLNRLVRNIDWGYKGNSLDVPTDCPQRDERAGWTGDAQVFAKTAMFHRNSALFFTKWLRDMEDGQAASGAYPDVAPSILGGGNAAWEDAGVICTYRLYEMYGDTDVVRQQWSSMTRFMAHLAATAPDGIRSAGAYGDWLLLDGPQQSPIHGTAYYFRSAVLMAVMADAIGKPGEAAAYRSLAAKICDVFNARFVGGDGRVTDKGRESQTFYALALDWEMLPVEKRAFAAKRLREMLRARGGLATGFIGTPVLLGGLARAGYAGESNALLLKDTYPSWLYQVKLGATTMWERWDGWTPDKGFQNPGMNSFNHYWLGCVGEWMYTGIAGIDTDGPGWSKVIIRPQITGNLQRARCAYDSLRGVVACSWSKKSDGSLKMEIEVPANVTATVFVPSKSADRVREGSKLARYAAGVAFVRQEPDATVFKVGSGKYTFIMK